MENLNSSNNSLTAHLSSTWQNVGMLIAHAVFKILINTRLLSTQQLRLRKTAEHFSCKERKMNVTGSARLRHNLESISQIAERKLGPLHFQHEICQCAGQLRGCHKLGTQTEATFQRGLLQQPNDVSVTDRKSFSIWFKSKSPQESNKIKFPRQGLKTQFRSPFAYS